MAISTIVERNRLCKFLARQYFIHTLRNVWRHEMYKCAITVLRFVRIRDRHFVIQHLCLVRRFNKVEHGRVYIPINGTRLFCEI